MTAYATTEAPFDLSPLAEPAYTERMTLAERFSLWSLANPHAVALAEHLTEQWLAAGHDRCSIGAVWERMRWESGVHAPDGSGWSLNNDYRSGMARLLMDRRPEWAGVFATRRCPALDPSP